MYFNMATQWDEKLPSYCYVSYVSDLFHGVAENVWFFVFIRWKMVQFHHWSLTSVSEGDSPFLAVSLASRVWRETYSGTGSSPWKWLGERVRETQGRGWSWSPVLVWMAWRINMWLGLSQRDKWLSPRVLTLRGSSCQNGTRKDCLKRVQDILIQRAEPVCSVTLWGAKAQGTTAILGVSYASGITRGSQATWEQCWVGPPAFFF